MSKLGWIITGVLGVGVIVTGYVLIQNNQKLQSQENLTSTGLSLLNTVSGWFA
jgi:hypothetical protein